MCSVFQGNIREVTTNAWPKTYLEQNVSEYAFKLKLWRSWTHVHQTQTVSSENKVFSVQLINIFYCRYLGNNFFDWLLCVWMREVGLNIFANAAKHVLHGNLLIYILEACNSGI